MERMLGRCVGRRLSYAVVVTAMASLLSGCWLQLGYSGGHTRSNPSERTLTSDSVGGLRPVWSVQPGGGSSEAIVSGGKVYVTVVEPGVSAEVVAYRLADGMPAWRTTIMTAPGFDSLLGATPVTLTGGRLETGWYGAVRTRGGLVCLAEEAEVDPDTGALTRGPSDLPGPMASDDGVVAWSVSSFGDNCPYLSQSNVTVRVDRAGAPAGSWYPEAVGEPSVAGDQVFVRYAIFVDAYAAVGCGARTCPPIWRQHFDAPPDAVATAATGPTYVVAGTEVVALDRTTGAVLWRAELGGPSYGLAVTGHTVFASVWADGGPSRLVALPGAGCGEPSCAPVWTADLSGSSPSVPAVGGDVVYVSTSDAVQAFDATGCDAATCSALVSVPASEAGRVSVADGHVLVAGETTLTALSIT